VKYPTATIAQEEIFGPVVAVLRVKDFQEAIAVANNTNYALTGGLTPGRQPIFRWHKSSLKWATCILIATSQVRSYPGNLSVGSSSLASALRQETTYTFLEPRMVTENIQRQGFAPIEGAD